MNKEDAIAKLKEDEHYYGDFGKKYLSNSDISNLLSNPLALGQPSQPNPAFVVGDYFHTAILEPDKLKNFKIVKSSSRNTKEYKEISNGEICLLQHEVDMIELMTDKVLQNDICRDLIRDEGAEYELPGITELEGQLWKGKADIVNHNQRLIIDLKTTADISNFKYLSSKYNYDSQAYIYSKIFGYDLIFIAIDKTSHQIGIFDCSDSFLEKGQDKVKRAVEAYELFFITEGFDPKQFFITKTL